ncbi:DUF2958 domain-containing protein (plasmid) [Alicyclobacillus acidoterrestris]|uniref:DUF2958 domain-containing protein n=1 Tax=Alicyclobacillus acidoterrestris TaxID=1450 RepID=UPI003F5295B6
MELWPKSLAEITPKIFDTEQVPENEKRVVAKFFALGTNLSWYVVEAQELAYGDVLFFGYGRMDSGHSDGHWGYFTLHELIRLRYMGIPQVERDLHFQSKRFADLDIEHEMKKDSPLHR